jgi:DNA-binding NtrC family response regulator
VRSKAARELGISRVTLYKKMRQHGLHGSRAATLLAAGVA